MSEITNPNAEPQAPRLKRSRFRFGVALIGALIGGAIGGTGGFALAGVGPMGGGWHHGPPIGHIQCMLEHALDSVGATSVQETKVHDIVASTYTGLMQDAPDREAMRKEVVALLRAPTIDRDAVERLRADQVARFDRTSKAVAAAVLDSADQLTAEQRVALADRAEAMMDSRGGMGDGFWRHRRHGEPGDDAAPQDDGPGKD